MITLLKNYWLRVLMLLFNFMPENVRQVYIDRALKCIEDPAPQSEDLFGDTLLSLSET